MQCKKCSTEIKTTGFRLSSRVECEGCGALYEPSRVRDEKIDRFFWLKIFLYFIVLQIAASRSEIEEYFGLGNDAPYDFILWLFCIAILAVVEIYLIYRHKKIHGAGFLWRYVGTKESRRRKRRWQFNLDAKMLLGVVLSAVLVAIVLFQLAY